MSAKLKIVGLDVEISGGTRHERKLALRAAMDAAASMIAGEMPVAIAEKQCAWKLPLEEQVGRRIVCDRCGCSRISVRQGQSPAARVHGAEQMNARLEIAKPEHEVAYQDLCALANRHAAKLTALELLAIGANMLGKLVAMQDQRSVSPAQAMEIVALNIEHGNKQIFDQLAGKSAGSA